MTVREMILKLEMAQPDSQVWIATRDSEPDQFGAWGWGCEPVGLIAIDRDGDVRLHNDALYSAIMEVL
jgi:hypothetical protein